MFAKKTKTTEIYILPEEFKEYTEKGFVIFMAKPTAFGTYRAIKIEVVKQNVSNKVEKRMLTVRLNKSNPIIKFWSNFHQQYLSI